MSGQAILRMVLLENGSKCGLWDYVKYPIDSLDVDVEEILYVYTSRLSTGYLTCLAYYNVPLF